jgi:hypothetical protein
VQFLLDGSSLGVSTAAPFTASLNPAGFADGVHSLSAIATDLSGNMATASTKVTLTRPDTTAPAISLTAPISLSTVSGTITLSASASDNVGVASVQFKLDGANYGAAVSGPPYTLSLNTATLSNGAHTVSAIAVDAAGNAGSSAPVQITVNNSPPVTGCATPAVNAFTGCYYSGQNFGSLVFSRTDAAIHFDWTGTGPQGASTLGPDNYSVRWQGNYQFAGGSYQFTLNMDDGGRLYIDGVLVYGNWTQHGSMPVNIAITLTPGKHLIQVEYFQALGGAVAQLSWSPAS